MKFYIETLGCYKNRVDSEVITSILEKKHRFTRKPQNADIIIINTCTFIEEATAESIETILQFCKIKGKKIIVIGCLGQRYTKKIMKEIPEVDAVIGTYGFDRIEEVMERIIKSERVVDVRTSPEVCSVDYSKRRILGASHYAYIKISDGCNRKCSFCIIPELKGKLKSRPIKSIIKEVNELVKGGVKEIILIAQDTTAYGMDIYGKKRLCNLLENLVRIKDLKWLRLLYNYPGEIDERLLELIATEPKICNYLDIPIQHISDSILRRMKREVSGKEIRKWIIKIRENYPNIFLRTTIMVGFPGETEKDFIELCNFIREIRFERLGVFAYSREYGTDSYNLTGQVSETVKLERKQIIMELQREISLENNKRFVGRTLPVIIDEEMNEKYRYDGRTEYDAPEIDNGVFITDGTASPGDIVPVKITNATCYDLIGVIRE